MKGILNSRKVYMLVIILLLHLSFITIQRGRERVKEQNVGTCFCVPILTGYYWHRSFLGHLSTGDPQLVTSLPRPCSGLGLPQETPCPLGPIPQLLQLCTQPPARGVVWVRECRVWLAVPSAGIGAGSGHKQFLWPDQACCKPLLN